MIICHLFLMSTKNNIRSYVFELEFIPKPNLESNGTKYSKSPKFETVLQGEIVSYN